MKCLSRPSKIPQSWLPNAFLAFSLMASPHIFTGARMIVSCWRSVILHRNPHTYFEISLKFLDLPQTRKPLPPPRMTDSRPLPPRPSLPLSDLISGGSLTVLQSSGKGSGSGYLQADGCPPLATLGITARLQSK